MNRRCETCMHWEDVNLGRCLYVPPPVVRKMYELMQAEPAARIDYNVQLAADIHSPKDGCCSEHATKDN